MRFVRKSTAQRKLHKLLGLVNFTGETVALVDRSGSIVAVILSARDFKSGEYETMEGDFPQIDADLLDSF